MVLKEEATITHTDETGLPVIFGNLALKTKTEDHQNGWLPNNSNKIFENYCQHLSYPLQILEMPMRRQRLVQGIVKALPDSCNGDLFGTPEKHIEELLNQILELKDSGKTLYLRWVQECQKKRKRSC